MNQIKKDIFFETILAQDGQTPNLEYHEQRIFNTISKKIDLSSVLNPPSKGIFRIKMIYDKNKILETSYFAYQKKRIRKLQLVYADTIDDSFKYLDRSDIDALYSKRKDSDEIIIVKNGFISDTSIANICIFKNNQWITPKIPLLKGTTRERLLKNNFIVEKNISIDELISSKKIALMNAMIGFDIYTDYQIIV